MKKMIKVEMEESTQASAVECGPVSSRIRLKNEEFIDDAEKVKKKISGEEEIDD